MEEIKEIAIKIMDKDTPYPSLIFVVALLLFFLLVIVIIDQKTDKSLDKIFGFARFVLILLSLIFIFVIIVGETSNENITTNTNDEVVNSLDLIGMYQGNIYSRDINKYSQLRVSGKSRLDIDEDNFVCVIYSENDTIEQRLGIINPIRDSISEFSIPKIGWVKCSKKGELITLSNHPTRNNQYYFKFEKQ